MGAMTLGKSARGAAALAAFAALGLAQAGCAAEKHGVVAHAAPSDLRDAEVAVERARRSPEAAAAPLELYDAEVALAAAKRDAKARSPLASSRAYVAQRMAERAKIAGRYAFEQEAAERAHDTSQRLRETLERRAEESRERDLHAQEDAARRTGEREAMLRALEGARRGAGELIRGEDEVRIRLPTEIMFEPQAPVLRRDAKPRLSAIADAVREGPPCSVWIQVLDDVEGRSMDSQRLARRRVARVQEALLASGVPSEAFFARTNDAPASLRGRTPPGTQVDIIVIEKPVQVSPLASTP